MTQIPRKPTFPSYMVQKLRAKIMSDVQEDVIPVSTGIYSYQKLKNKLQAIPKPQIQNYQDKIFFEIIQDRLALVDKTGQKCASCDQEYNKKNPATMCNFCALWCCSNCMPLRKRPHPLSKDGSGKRYNVCQRCDTKYLNLQLGHSYVQNRSLLEQAIVKTSEELQSLMSQCQEYQQVLGKSKQGFEKNKFKISQLRKERLQLTKQIKNKMPEQIKQAEDRQQELKVKFVDIHLKRKEWLELSEINKKQRQQKQKQRMKQQKQQQEQRRRVAEQQLIRRQHQEERKQRQRKQRQRVRLEEQEQNKNRLNFKRIPSLQQNSTLSMNITYTNSQSNLQNNTQPNPYQKASNQTLDKKKSDDFAGYDTYRRDDSEQQQEEVRARQLSRTSLNHQPAFQNNQPSPNTINHQYPSPSTSLQQSQFAQYFRHSQPEQPYIKDSSYKNEPQPLQGEQTEHRIDSFTFNEKNTIDNSEKDDLNDWSNLNGHCSTNNKDDKEGGLRQEQYTFQNSKLENYDNTGYYGDQPWHIPIQVPKPYHPQQQQQQQNNHLSYIDQWYVNKSNQNNKQKLATTSYQQQTYSSEQYQQKPGQSSLSTALYSPTSTGVSNNSTNQYKKEKTQQQLQEQCITSQLDQQQLQVARYSLIKAARDSAVEERHRNKIYQKSIYQNDTAPYDQEQAQTVDEIKKCQCSIY